MVFKTPMDQGDLYPTGINSLGLNLDREFKDRGRNQATRDLTLIWMWGTCRDIFHFHGYVIFCLFTYANLLFYSIFQLKLYISTSK